MAPAFLLSVLTFIGVWIRVGESHSLFQPHLINSTEYSAGLYGAYPHQKYHSVDLESPILNILKWDESCGDSYTFMGPRTKSVLHPGPMILDDEGNLIWTSSKFGSADNLQIQTYKGEKFLTFWAGVDQSQYWPGYFYMLDSSYQIRHVITPTDIKYGDNHEFKILEGGTALMTVFLTGHVFEKEGFGNGWIRDSIFQEVNIATGELLFEWRASEHMNLTDSYVSPRPGAGHSEEKPYEWFHINSVDKDPAGNYFVSSRYLCMVAYIDGSDGHVIWTLGGKHSSFKDLSDGAASNFSYQHHAVYLGNDHPLSATQRGKSDTITLSLFDNGAIRHGEHRAEESRGMLIDLNTEKMTAKLFRSFVNPTKQLSLSQGSVDILPGSNHVLVGWGASPAWTEYLPDGTVLCDVHFGAFAFWDFSFAQTYRVYKVPKREWIGKPKAPPDIAIGKGESGQEAVFASWNGATHVKSWRLQGSHRYIPGHPHRMQWDNLQKLPKKGFEIAFDMVNATEDDHHMSVVKRHGDSHGLYTHQYVRVQALGRKGHALKSTFIIDRHTHRIIDPKDTQSEWALTDGQMAPIFLLCVCSSLAFFGHWLYVKYFKNRIDLGSRFIPVKL